MTPDDANAKCPSPDFSEILAYPKVAEPVVNIP